MNNVRNDNKLFFKYRPLDGRIDLEKTKELLIENKLAFSSPSDFNDPFDCAFLVQNKGTKEDWEEYLFWIGLDEETVRYVLTNELEETGKNIYEYSKNIPHISKDYNVFFGEFIHILSLSQICDNILMWSHYASNHKGICLSFKSELEDGNLGFYFDSDFLPLYEIKYQEEFPTAMNMLCVTTTFIDFLTTKYFDWNYEKEWRLFDQNVDENNISFKQFNKDSLECIIFGLHTPTDYIKEIYDVAKKYYLDEGHNIDFYKCKWIEGKYSIKPERIESFENLFDSEREVIQNSL